MTELVSVVIPARNAAEFIGTAIRSALCQTYPSIEIVVVDDGSEDETSAVAAAVGDARTHVVRTKRLGVSAARNLGLRQSNGTYVAFLDADDYWLPDKLTEQVTVLETDQKCVLVGTLMRYESVRGRVLGVAGEVVGENDQERIRKGYLMPFPISSVLFRKSALNKLGGFDENLQSFIPGLVDDIELVARAARIGSIRAVPRVLGAYRIHSGSASVRHFRSQRLGTRFVRARLAAQEAGTDLSWQEFVAKRRLNCRQRWTDVAQGWYRCAGLCVADRRWLRGVAFGSAALALSPLYVVKRLYQQRCKWHE